MFAFLKKLFGSKQEAEAAAPYKIEAPQVEAAPAPVAKPTKEKPVRKPRAKKSVKK